MGNRAPDAREADASPLFGLAQIGRLALLPDLFDAVLVPPAVGRETALPVGRQPWLVERPLARPIPPRVRTPSLGAGETEAIALALEAGVSAILVDERAGRRLAAAVGLDVVGTVGILLRAKERGHLVSVRPDLDALLGSGFFISTSLYRYALLRAGEAG